MSAPRYTFRRGAPITLALRVTSSSSDPSLFVATAKLKRADYNADEPPASEAETVATFAVTFRPAAGNDPARFMLVLDAEQTSSLPATLYVTDVAFALSGEVAAVSSPAVIDLKNSVSG